MANARTARDLITAALLALAVVDPGETLGSDEAAAGLESLQDLLDEWSGKDLLVPFATWENKTLSSGTASYTIGEDSAAWDTVRPDTIIDAYIRDSSSYDHPVGIIQSDAYKVITAKTTQGRPYQLYYNPTAPNGTIYLYFTPNAAEDLWICGQKPLSSPSGLTVDMLDDVAIPKSYYNPLKWNLALDLAPSYGIGNPSPVIVGRAQEGKSNITALNFANRIQPAAIEVQQIAGGRYTILAD